MPSPLIPLGVVGVFLSFTRWQAGLVRHWLRGRGQCWPEPIQLHARFGQIRRRASMRTRGAVGAYR